MRRIRLAIVPLVLLTGVVSGAPVARADCSGPTLGRITTDVDRGRTITITGTSFGDNCHDTGPPPPGEGVLGRPLTDIDVVIEQGDTTIVLAHGDAGADYAFDVEIVVPQALQPGPATIDARWGDSETFRVLDQPITITDVTPIDTGDESVVRFGPTPGEAPAPTTAMPPTAAPARAEPASPSDDGGSGLGWPLLVGAFAAVAGGSTLGWFVRRAK
jgi:hypothetical protein